MNIKRKIQWAAAAVLVNAMAALVSLSSSNAEAGTCTQPGPKVLCEPGHGGYCPTQPTLACSAYAPPRRLHAGERVVHD